MPKIRAAAADALLEEVGVSEDDNPHRIYEYVEQCGAQWDLDWNPDNGFDRSVYWCGYAAGWAYIRCGRFIENTSACYDIRMRHGITTNVMGSTSRLAGKLNANGDPWASLAVPPFERIHFEDIQKGDICVVATGRKVREWGDHITLATGAPDMDKEVPDYPTVEGNIGDNVITGRREFAETAIVYRPGIEHMTGTLKKELADG